MNHVIFLDFDGVMHPVGACVWNADEQAMVSVDPFRWWPALERILKGSTVPITLVVHSTWRLMWETDEELLGMLPESMRAFVVGTTDRNDIGREKSIVAYTAKHGIVDSLILDDEAKAFARGLDNLIVCDDQHGVSDPTVLRAIAKRVAQWSLPTEQPT